MARDVKRLFREAFDLPENERATLAGLLVESIEGAPDLHWYEAHGIGKKELKFKKPLYLR